MVRIQFAGFFVGLWCILVASDIPAQQKKNTKPKVSERGPVLSQHAAIRFEVGATIQGGPTPCQNLKVVIPVPLDTPEQSVTLDDQSIPASSNLVEFREQPGLKQMVVTVPTLRPNQELTFRAIFNVQVNKIQPPADPSIFMIPKNPPKEAKAYLGVSPGINLKHPKIKATLKEIVADKESAWEEVKAIFDWININIEESPDLEMDDASQAFLDKRGCPEDRIGLFVGMCRLHKVPARTVWVEGAVQAEFFLVDDQDLGAWFPVKLTGIAEFGADSNPAVIFQKGDNFRVPEKKDPQRFVTETMVVQGSDPPRDVQFFARKMAGVGK